MLPPPEDGAKENSGAMAKRRRRKRSFLWVIAVLFSYVSVTTIYESHFAGMLVPDVEIDAGTGRARVRRRPAKHKKRLDPSQKTCVTV